MDKVRELQRSLYSVAKRQRERRFCSQRERIRRGDVLLEAWPRLVILEECMLPERIIGKPHAGNPHVRFERGRQEAEPARRRV